MSETPVWLINAFGVAAGLCSMASFIPQIAKILRERDATGVSVRMYLIIITIIGFGCWTTYGLLSHAWPVAGANAICIALTVTILVLRLRFGEGRA